LIGKWLEREEEMVLRTTVYKIFYYLGGITEGVHYRIKKNK